MKKKRSGLMVCLLFFLSLEGCSPSCPWTCRHVRSDCSEYNSSCLTFLPHNQFNGVELQILQGCFGTLGYLNVYCGQITPLPGDERHARVLIVIEEEKYVFTAVLYAGGQRLLLPAEAAQLLVSALRERKPILISLKDHYLQLSSEIGERCPL